MDRSNLASCNELLRNVAVGEGACEKSGIRQWGGGVLVSTAGRSLAAGACITSKAN